MIISGRERLIILAAASVVAILLLDRYVITPLDEYRDALDVRKQRLLGDMDRAQALLEHKRKLAPKWREMIAGGLKGDPSEAESQVLHLVQDWSQEAGLKLTSLKPDRLIEKRNLQEISFQAAGTGSMKAVSRFLWRLETAKAPIRVKEMQLGARKEGSDDLTLQLRLSTLYQAAQPPAPSGTGAPSDSKGDTE